MKAICVFFLMFSTTYSLTILNLGRKQFAAVNGTLLCNEKPIRNVKVKLYDVDVAIDDLMAEGKSKNDGTFLLRGSQTELTKIDPKLNIYHNCNDEKRECLRKVEIKIDSKFITEGTEPEKMFDIGKLDLSAHYPGESRDCIN